MSSLNKETSMDQSIFLKQFETECYPKANQEMLKQTIEYMTEKASDIVKECKEEINQFLLELHTIQTKKQCSNIGSVSICIPYDGICNQAPYYYIEAYEGRAYLTKEIYSKEVKTKWIMNQWKEELEYLMNIVTENQMGLYVKKPYVEAIHRKNIKQRLLILSTILKTHGAEIETYESYQNLEKDDYFTITFGGFYDWQRPIFARYPTKNIIEHPKEKSFTYMKFEREIYTKQNFDKLDFDNSSFIQCEFHGCNFKRNTLCDTQFESCYFVNCTFEDTIMYGTILQACQIEHTTMKEIKTNCFTEKNTKYFGLYGTMIWNACNLKQVTLEQVDFTASELISCEIKGLQEQHSIFSKDYEPYLNADKGDYHEIL